jgi:mediator of replication checkpoint protein 1
MRREIFVKPPESACATLPLSKCLFRVPKNRNTHSEISSMRSSELNDHSFLPPTLTSLDRLPQQPPSSDPIQSFSSSPPATSAAQRGPRESGASAEVTVPHAIVTSKSEHPDVPAPAIGSDSDSDGDLPEVSEMLKEQEQKHAEAERAKQLAETKKRALAIQAEFREAGVIDDSDDGLEIVDDMKVVAAEERVQRRAIKAKHLKPSEGRKRQLAHGRVHVVHGRTTPVRKSKDPLAQLKVLAQPTFGSSSRDQRGKGAHVRETLNQADLNRMLAKKIEEDKAKITQMKEEEWVRRGGKLGTPLRQGKVESRAIEGAWKTYAERGLKVNEEQMSEEDEDGSDEDWTPETRGSVSPPRNEIDDDATGVQDQEVATEEGHTTNGEGDNDADEELDDSDLIRPRAPRHAAGRSRAIHDSDEDDEDDCENAPISPFGRVLVPDTSFEQGTPTIGHRRSSSSLEDRTEDDTDKENNTRLMYDKSEDKENKAVVRYSPLANSTRGTPLFALSKSLNGLSSSFAGGIGFSDEDDEPVDRGRKPFKELLDHEDDPFTSQPRSEISFVERLQQASPVAPPPTSTPQSVTLGSDGSGFSQFFDEGESGDKSPFLLDPLKLSQPFEFGTEPGQPNRPTDKVDRSFFTSHAVLTICFLQRSILDHLRKPDDSEELSLTLDVGLQPALEVSEKFRRQADSIFEKEQGYLIEAARRKPAQRPELYVNDHGYRSLRFTMIPLFDIFLMFRTGF